MVTNISKIIKNDLCLGCGLCEAISPKSMLRINVNGFYRPDPIPTDHNSINKIIHCCPGIHIESVKGHNTDVWGG